jgi:hypothetical protein
VDKCDFCDREGLPLGDIQYLDGKVFDKLSFIDIVQRWSEKGFSMSTIVCDECLIK